MDIVEIVPGSPIRPEPSSRRSRTPTLTLFCGLPGSGKTTLARQLEADGVGIRVCTDDWQAELGVPPQDTGFHDRLQPLLYRHALALLEHGTDVIVEDGLWTRGERSEKFADARLRGARIELHVFDVPRDVLWARLQERNASAHAGAYPMSEEELDRACQLFEAPSAAELSDIDHVQIHTATDIRQQVLPATPTGSDS